MFYHKPKPRRSRVLLRRAQRPEFSVRVNFGGRRGWGKTYNIFYIR
jgi:hypothetical protein